MPTCKHKASGKLIVRSVSTDVCCQGVQIDRDDIFNKARFLSVILTCITVLGFHGCEMLRLAFELVLEFFGGGGGGGEGELAFYFNS